MSLPKSKMLSASKSIMAVASLKHDMQKLNQHQKQVVNVNVNSTPSTPQVNVVYPKPYEIDEGIVVVPNSSQTVQPITSPQSTPTIQPTIPTPAQDIVQTRDVDMGTIEELKTIINNNETAVKALIMIIDIMQNNPLVINKLIVAYAQQFKDLVQVLTNADDVDVQYIEDVGCFASSKYKLVDDIYVIKDGDAQSLKYSYPDVLRLFDRFKISVKMIAITQ